MTLLHPMTNNSITSQNMTATSVLAIRNGSVLDQRDWLASEEPLEIRVQGPGQKLVSIAVTMRTPGHDHELAAGFLYTEGLIRSGDEIVAIEADELRRDGRPCNVVSVQLSHSFDQARLKRNFYATSSCGICGKASLEQIAVQCPPVAPGPVLARYWLLSQLPCARHCRSSSRRAGYMPQGCST